MKLTYKQKGNIDLKGLRNLKFISDLKLLIGKFNPRKHNKEFLLGRLESYFTRVEEEKISDFTHIALKNQTVINTVNPIEFKASYYIDPVREFNLPINFILQSFAIFCEHNKDNLNFFYRGRREVESCVIKGSFDKALDLVKEIEDKIGKSIWSIDIRMNIYSRRNDDGAKDYKEYLEKENIAHLATLVHRKYTSSSLNVYNRQVLGNLLIEYRNNGLNRYADFLSTFLLPDFVDEEVNIHDLIIFSQRLSPIDQLLLINRLCIRALSDDATNKKLLDPLLAFSNRVKDSLEHSSWHNITLYSEGKITPRINKTTQQAIESYSSGDYFDAIKICKTAIEDNPLDLSILDIYVRSVIYTEDTSDLDDSSANITDLSNQLLVSLVHVHHSVSNYELHSETFDVVFFKYLNFDFVTSIKPMFYAAYHYENVQYLKKACIELFCSEYQITPKYIRFLKDKKFSFKILDSLVSKEKITRSRRLRAQIEKIIIEDNKTPEYCENINYLLVELEQQKDVLQSEFYYLWYQGKISTGQISEALEKVSSKLIESSDNQYLFPLKDIAALIESNRDTYIANIDAVIVYYFYFRLQDFHSKESMSEFFEDFLTANDKTLASDLASTWSSLNSKKTFFLKEVCNVDVMSILLSINSNEELLFERLKVLQELLRLAPDKEDDISEEESSLYEQLYIDILSIEHSSNKIDIDIKGIKKAKLSEYETYFDLFSEFNTEIPEDLLKLFEVDEESGLTKKDNAILHFYGRAYESILNDFIFDDDFGLVRYLSSEIRHGWLPNQIRSVIESYNLITELGGNNKYESNSFWLKKYELTVTSEILDKIDEIFSWFSKEVDILINIANGWPQATRDPGNRNVAFNVSYDFETLKDFRSFTRDSKDSNEFFELCTEFIWSRLDEGFRIMRSLINKELKPNFNKLFDVLLNKLSELGIELTLLRSEILNAKTKTIDEIGIIEGWFCRPEYRNFGSVALQDAIKVAIENTKGIYNPRELVIEVKEGCLDVEVEQTKMLSLIRGLVTAFQNSIKYGQKANSIDITFGFQQLNNELSLIISNEINERTYKSALDKKIVDRVEKYNKENEKELLVTEGGTGLYKIFRFIKDAYPDAIFRIILDKTKFTQVITLKIKDLS